MSGIKDYKIVHEYGGYIHKRDQTNALDELGSYRNMNYVANITNVFLVQGSQNVIINDSDKVAIRGGYTLDGAAGTTSNPVVASYDWLTNTGVEYNMRASADNGGCLQFRYIDPVTTAVSYQNLLTSIGTSINYNFTTWWDATEVRDKLIFVNGTPNLFAWSGGVTTVASVTSNTITKQTTDNNATWAAARFWQNGTRIVTINGIDYTYTGGEGTATLTGVTPDPTAGSITAGMMAIQKVRTTANTPGSGVNNSIVAVLRNQLWVADTSQQTIYVSLNTDYTSYVVASPRPPGGAFVGNVDSSPVGFVPQDDTMYISCTPNDWYTETLTLSTDLTAENLKINKLQSGPRQSARSQAAIAKTKNKVAFVSFEPTIDELGRVENITTPQTLPLSDPIKLDIDAYNYTNVHALYYRYKLFIALPVEGKVLIYDYSRSMWYPPQILPVRRLAIIGGLLYGHSSITNETYKLFDGTSDNGNPINAIAAFAYRNYGKRARLKNFTEWYSEGYINSNTKINLILNYDFGGSTTIQNYTISGSDTTILQTAVEDDSFGKTPFGEKPLGSALVTPSSLSKFRIVHTMSKTDFFEVQTIYQSNSIDQQWEILAFGGDVVFSDADIVQIKK